MVSLVWIGLLVVSNVHIVLCCNDCLPCECNVVYISRRPMCSANCSNMGLTSIPDNIPLDVAILDLSYNKIQSADLKQLGNKTEYLVKLNLSNNEITRVPPGSLSTASNLQELNLEGNVLDSVNSDSFGNLKQLRRLTGLQTKAFEELTFENLKTLDYLYIIYTGEKISGNIFAQLKLRTLSMKLTVATSLPSNIFSFGVDTLLEIHLDALYLRNLHENTFNGLTILKTVTLKAKAMHTLPSFIFHTRNFDFRRMPVNLNTVMIDGVKSLPRNLFDQQQSLKYIGLNNIEDLLLSSPSESQIDTLDLSGSTLYRLDHDMFSSFKSLRSLNLSNTDLAELSNISFHTLSSLTILDLSFNGLRQIPGGIFKASKNTLVTLNISHNRIQNISQNMLESVKSLENLDVSNNMLTYIDKDAFKDQFMLAELLLNDNDLVYISEETFVDQSSLVDLNIARNKIEQLPKELFENARSLKRLDVSGNKIQTLPYDFFKSVRHLEFVSLGNNPVHCDCSLMMLKDHLPRVQLLGKCELPPELRGTELNNLKLNDSCLIILYPTSVSYPQSTQYPTVVLHSKQIPLGIVSTPYEEASRIIKMESTSASFLYPTQYQTPEEDRETPEHAIGGNGYFSLFMGTSAFYIAIGCIVAVCIGSAIGVIIVRIRRKMRSTSYEVTNTTGLHHRIGERTNR